MVFKIIAWYITASNAILSDGLESFVNIAAGVFALFSVIIAARPKDIDHPYGHGKIEFLSAGFEGTLVGLAGLFIIGKAFYNLIHPQDLQDISLGIWIVLLTGIINLFLGLYLKKQGKQLSSISIEANGGHILSDAISSAGLVLGLIIIYFTSIVWIDNVVALIFGGIIFFTGYKLVRRSVAGVMDEADTAVIDEIIVVLNKNRKNSWIDIHNFRVIRYGADLHIDCHITLPWYHDLRQAHQDLKDIEDIIISHSKNKIEIFIHADPCIYSSCPICKMNNCPVRQYPFEKEVIWKLSNITPNQKHTLFTL
jgi:cation diffusion facilitator family transporter